MLETETSTKRQATQHGCLSRLLGEGANKVVLGQLEQTKQNKNLLYWHE